MERVKKNHDADKILSHGLKEWWVQKVFGPVETLFIRTHLSPNWLTIFGFLLTILAAVAFAMGHFAIASLLMLTGGCLDFLDGRVARATQQTSREGAFFDSVIDRYSDSALFIGLVYYFKDGWMFAVAILSLIGALMVSYTKARAEALQIECGVGLMQRPERLFYLAVGSLLSAIVSITLLPLTHGKIHPPYILMIVLIWIMALSNYTAFMRIKHVLKQIELRHHENQKL